MRIKVIEVGQGFGKFVIEDGELPAVGGRYELDDWNNPTNRQNRAFHALVSCYWTSGCHSSTATNFHRFRDEIKVRLGAGFEKILYADMVDGKAVIFEVKRKDEIPSHILADPDLATIAKAKPLSWGDYSKKQRTGTIDKLIAEMEQAGVNTPHFREILAGMSKEDWK